MMPSHPVCRPRSALRGCRPGRGGRFCTAIRGEGHRCLPLARVQSALNSGGDEVGEGVGLALGHLVEGAPRERAVTAQPSREPKE